jgi:hypothetical protein
MVTYVEEKRGPHEALLQQYQMDLPELMQEFRTFLVKRLTDHLQLKCEIRGNVVWSNCSKVEK